MSELQPHVLTDKLPTKEVPCKECGHPCIVSVFAVGGLVKCHAHRIVRHRGGARPALQGDPWSEDLTDETRAAMIEGRSIEVRYEEPVAGGRAPIVWEDTLVVRRIKRLVPADAESGKRARIEFFAVNGGFRCVELASIIRVH